jgi:hypothetical protein
LADLLHLGDDAGEAAAIDDPSGAWASVALTSRQAHGLDPVL